VLAGAKELNNVLLLLSDYSRGIVLATGHLFVLAACP
jgi:lipoprotein